MEAAYLIREQIGLSLAGAGAVIAAASAKAREIGVDMCIAVVDRGGSLLAFARMDGGRVGSVTIAMTKAVSAATRRRATADENGGDVPLGIRLALAANNTLTNIPGGLPIVVEGQVVGAIGVSSGTAEQDSLVAAAGLSALA
jgi:uncharacterized protein GlcG (DUF336 family)